jgi:hypothetical protein
VLAPLCVIENLLHGLPGRFSCTLLVPPPPLPFLLLPQSLWGYLQHAQRMLTLLLLVLLLLVL